jgi:hypothetical protein
MVWRSQMEPSAETGWPESGSISRTLVLTEELRVELLKSLAWRWRSLE